MELKFVKINQITQVIKMNLKIELHILPFCKYRIKSNTNFCEALEGTVLLIIFVKRIFLIVNETVRPISVFCIQRVPPSMSPLLVCERGQKT